MPEMKTRRQELNEMLDDLNAKIMQKYPEIENARLHKTIAKKVKLEIELAKQ